MTKSASKYEGSQHIADMHAVAQQRDQQAYARLFDHFAPLLRGFCLKAMPGANLIADEITQEVMLKVWQKAYTYKSDTAAVSTWIYTLARNARIDYLRKNSRHRSDIDPTDLWEELIDDGQGPFQIAQQKRSELQVRAGLEILPEAQHHILQKVYLEGKTHQQVAEELNLPLGTVKSRVRLALNKLAVFIKRS